MRPFIARLRAVSAAQRLHSSIASRRLSKVPRLTDWPSGAAPTARHLSPAAGSVRAEPGLRRPHAFCVRLRARSDMVLAVISRTAEGFHHISGENIAITVVKEIAAVRDT